MQVASCSSTVMPILAQDLALAPNQTQVSSFEVYVESAAAANLSCVVTLLDSQANPSLPKAVSCSILALGVISKTVTAKRLTFPCFNTVVMQM